jgi:hypothetical protein
MGIIGLAASAALVYGLLPFYMIQIDYYLEELWQRNRYKSPAFWRGYSELRIHQKS